jgi:acyl-coenzyme A synthetase/AMP-(fatty) acid ligase
MNIIDAIRHHARMRPYDLAVIHPGGAATYLQFAGAVSQLVTRLRSHGIAPGTTVAVYVSDPFLHLALTLACTASGLVAISAHPNYDPIPPEAGVGTYLADRALPFAPETSVITVGPNWISDGEPPELPPSPTRAPDAIVRLYVSSGTTGLPKVIGYTDAAGHAQTTLGLSLEPLSHGPNLSMMSLSTIGGFGTAHGTLWHGTTLVLATAPAAVLRAISLYGVASLQASPQQLQGLLDMVRGRAVRFPSLKRIQVGGATLPPSIALAARAMLCPNVVGIYGSTEAGGIAQTPAAVLQAVPDAAGYVMPGVEVQIVDSEGQPCAAGVEGVVRVRRPEMLDHYIGDPQASATSFRDGWFHPGDLGILQADGLLRITGRADEMINAGGVKVNPAMVDAFLMTQPGVVDAAAFARRRPGATDLVWAAVVTGEGFNEQAVLEACRQRLNSRAPVRLLQLAQIPRNAMGKAVRVRLTEDAQLL